MLYFDLIEKEDLDINYFEYKSEFNIVCFWFFVKKR